MSYAYIHAHVTHKHMHVGNRHTYTISHLFFLQNGTLHQLHALLYMQNGFILTLLQRGPGGGGGGRGGKRREGGSDKGGGGGRKGEERGEKGGGRKEGRRKGAEERSNAGLPHSQLYMVVY